MSTTTTSHVPPWMILVMGILAVSMASTLIRLAQADIDSLSVAAWRVTLASLILAPFALITRHEELRSLTRREWQMAVVSGLFLAIHFAAWITSLAMTSVAASLALVSTAPLFIGLIGYFFLGEPLSRSMLLGMLLAVGGSAVIGLGDMEGGTHHLTGDLLALVGALAAAGYFILGKKLRVRLSLLGYVFPVYSVAAVTLMGVTFLRFLLVERGMVSDFWMYMMNYAPSTWLWLFLLAVFPQIIGHSSLNWALRHLPATYISLSVLAEPVSSTLLVWVVLRESPTQAAILGGALILSGLFVAGGPSKASKSPSVELDKPIS